MSIAIIEVAALAYQRRSDGRYLLARRGPDQTGAGAWEFPGGKLEAHETQSEALCREIEEELKIQLTPNELRFVATSEHQYPERKIRLHLWTCLKDEPQNIELIEHDQITWSRPEEMRNLNLSAADIPFIDKLL